MVEEEFSFYKAAALIAEDIASSKMDAGCSATVLKSLTMVSSLQTAVPSVFTLVEFDGKSRRSTACSRPLRVHPLSAATVKVSHWSHACFCSITPGKRAAKAGSTKYKKAVSFACVNRSTLC